MNQKNYSGICEKVAHGRPGGTHGDLHAVFVDNKQLAMATCQVPLANARLIPKVLENEGYLFDEIFKEAVRDKAASILFIQHTTSRSGQEFIANSEDCKIFHAAREKAGLYGIPLHDYLLYNNRSLSSPYESYYKHDKHLSFNDFYGMR